MLLGIDTHPKLPITIQFVNSNNFVLLRAKRPTKSDRIVNLKVYTALFLSKRVEKQKYVLLNKFPKKKIVNAVLNASQCESY